MLKYLETRVENNNCAHISIFLSLIYVYMPIDNQCLYKILFLILEQCLYLQHLYTKHIPL